MKKLTMMAVILMVAMLAVAPVVAQQKAAPATGGILDKTDFGLGFTYKWAKAATTTGPEFFIQGGEIDAAYTPGNWWKKFVGVAAEVDGESASSVKPGVNLSQITVAAGPRVTDHCSRGSFYAESLFGVVHAFNSVFPSGSSVTTSATGFSSQYGGGINVKVTEKIGWRVGEFDWIYTKLPNATDGWQSDMRYSTGVTYHF
jgi:hypothetical protein